MTPEAVAARFTRAGEGYHFARWGRPIVPIIFGSDDASLIAFKSAIQAVAAVARHGMAETDPELGANLMIFCFRDWAELKEVPGLDHLVPGIAGIADRMAAGGADRYRQFRFDSAGAIRAAFVFLRLGGALADAAAEDLALEEALRMILLWGEGAFDLGDGPGAGLLRTPQGVTLHPEMAALLRAAYDPVLPPASREPGHALRLAARLPSLS